MKLIKKENVHNDLLYMWQTDANYEHFFGHFYPMSFEQVAYMNKDGENWMIVDSNDLKKIYGIVSFDRIDLRNRTARYHILIVKEHQNSGVFYEVTKLALDGAFKGLNLNKVYCEIGEPNQEAIAASHNFGALKEAVYHKEYFYDGKYWDIIRMVKFKES